MLCYRYFKELRNAQVHSGGIANQTAVDSYVAFQPVSDKAQLGRKGELAFDPIVLGQRVSLNLRGVVGFTDVLIKIISTINSEYVDRSKPKLSLSGHCERPASERCFWPTSGSAMHRFRRAVREPDFHRRSTL